MPRPGHLHQPRRLRAVRGPERPQPGDQRGSASVAGSKMQAAGRSGWVSVHPAAGRRPASRGSPSARARRRRAGSSASAPSRSRLAVEPGRRMRHRPVPVAGQRLAGRQRRPRPAPRGRCALIGWRQIAASARGHFFGGAGFFGGLRHAATPPAAALRRRSSSGCCRRCPAGARGCA